MEKETIDRICCNCIHYLHGQLESPCAKDNPNVGYLHEGCWRWQSEKGELVIPTKQCSVCGEVKPINKFVRFKDKYKSFCIECNKARLNAQYQKRLEKL